MPVNKTQNMIKMVLIIRDSLPYVRSGRGKGKKDGPQR